MNFDATYNFVNFAFENIKDKAGMPYIGHCVIVADLAEKLALKLGFGKRAARKFYYVGLLHDVVEDTDITFEELQEKLNVPQDIMEGVEAMTHYKGEPYEDYMKRVSANKYATLVKMADMAHNMQLDRYDPEKRTEKRVGECLKYGEKLFNLIRM